MLGVMPMQWYVNLVTIAAVGVLGWIVLEFLAKPIRAFFALRDRVRAQLLLLANVAPPKPRETISTSLEIQQYDVAVKAGGRSEPHSGVPRLRRFPLVKWNDVASLGLTLDALVV